MELQAKERRQASVYAHPAAKRFKVADVTFGVQRGRNCGRCDKVHDAYCQSSFGCQKCGKEGHCRKDCRQ